MDSWIYFFILALDIDNKEPILWGEPTYKPWWVQLEALVATAYAYKYTKDEWFNDAHKRINEYAFTHYPTPYGDINKMVRTME